MNFIYSPYCLEHITGNHPECRERLLSFSHLPAADATEGEKYLSLVHSREHIEQVRQACLRGWPLDGDTLTSPGSYQAASAALGLAVSAATQADFALIRPPGHHAYPDRSSGFCLFNNMATATRYLLQENSKVFILDIDGHFGDGTSSIFYEDPQVLFCSIHQFPAFPGNGWIDEIGAGSGLGYNINVPLPAGAGDDILNESLEFILGIARQFAPDALGVSAGFDGYQNDPLLQLRYSLDGYFQCGRWLKQHFSNIKVFALLEGGYNLKMLPKCIHNFRDGFNGDLLQFPETGTVSSAQVKQKFQSNLSALKSQLHPYWEI